MRRRVFNSKRAQGVYEMIMLVTGVLLIVTTFIVVFATRSSIPEPNLASKTILLTEKTFDSFEFMFNVVSKEIIAQTPFVSTDSFGTCQKIVAQSSQTSSSNPLEGFYLITPECASPLLQEYVTSIETKFDTFFESDYISSQSSYSSVIPRRYVLIDPSKEFMPRQFRADVILGSDSASVLVVSRRPLTVSATANMDDSDSLRWRLSAQRYLITQVAMPPSQYHVLQLTQHIGDIKSVAWLQMEQTLNGKRANGESLTDADKEQFVTDITAALNDWVVFPSLTPLSQLSVNDYFAYVVLLHDNAIYVAFPNAQLAIHVYTFV